MIYDRDDSEMTDAVLRSEIELLAEVMDALSQASGPLTDDQINAVLGLSRPVRPEIAPAAEQRDHRGCDREDSGEAPKRSG